MKNLYEEEWFSKLYAVICILILLVGFGIQNLLVLMLPFILAGGYFFFRLKKEDENRLLFRLLILMSVLPFILAFVFILCGNARNAWFDAYNINQWVMIFTGLLIYAGTLTLGFSAFSMNKWSGNGARREKETVDVTRLSFITVYPKNGKKVESLPMPGDLEHHKQLVIPINKKTDWVKIPCHLKNESALPVISVGLEALNDEIKGTKSMDHALLIPPYNTVGIDLYIPLTSAKGVDIKCSFKNVLGEKTAGFLHLDKTGDVYHGIYNLRIVES